MGSQAVPLTKLNAVRRFCYTKNTIRISPRRNVTANNYNFPAEEHASVADSAYIIEVQVEALREYCLSHFLRIITEGTDRESLESELLPKFGYVAQISHGELTTSKPFLLLVLNEGALIDGLIVEFKDCAEIEIQLVIEEIINVAGRVIDFIARMTEWELIGALNTECYFIEH